MDCRARRRHLADLRIAEVTRALRALSSAYVERRHASLPAEAQRAKAGPLDSAGKRAAFALFYAPLHYLATRHVLRSLDRALIPPPSTIVDLGCGNGAAGAAWAVAAGTTSRVTGIDRHPWAVEEARWTYRTLRLDGITRQGDATRAPAVKPGSGIVAAYLLNELPGGQRARVEDQLIAAGDAGLACSSSNRLPVASRPGGRLQPHGSARPAAARTSGGSRSSCRRCCRRWIEPPGSATAN